MLDVTPTVLDILDLGYIADEEQMIGKSLLPLVNSPSAMDRGTTDYLHITENTWMKKRGIRTHRWKYIVPLETPDIHGNSAVELYDLYSDPGELCNIAEEHPTMVAQLQAQMDAHIARRLKETGQSDPLPVQPIPLKRVGSMDVAVPEDRRLRLAKEKGGDEKLPDGDFIGYDREK